MNDELLVTRREVLRTAAAVAATLIAGCRTAPQTDAPAAAPGRLLARAAPPSGRPAAVPSSGLSSLRLASGRDGLLYVPAAYRASAPAPLVVMLHGAGQSAYEGIDPFLSLADAGGLVLLAPDSRGKTWDFLYGPYGADVAFIDQALAYVFRRLPIDAAAVTVEGFSDGASYALSLGLTNGDLFSRIVAFSPCILAPAAHIGHPRIFISHGTEDRVLPIERCGRALAQRLEGAGYPVTYREFTGRHGVPADVAREAAGWLRT
jgi:phospholipase/carboxylesterase